MWRQQLPDGRLYDIWGRPINIVEHASGAYEEAAGWLFQTATSVEDIKTHLWPEPDWWDFSPLPAVIKQLDDYQEYHIRYRIGSVFESAWQLRGMQEFLMDLALKPEIPAYLMDRLTEIHVENTRRVLELAGDRLDMVYFYDDVATQNSLMISPQMWQKLVRPCHVKLIELAKAYNLPVMYHCDGAIYPLISDLIDEFGDRLSFHGGIDIIKTLPRGSVDDVTAEVRERVRVIGENGGYILASSHHIQPDTPIENVVAMYDVSQRYRAGA
jgi:uroporphyrinogen decarboxylase